MITQLIFDWAELTPEKTAVIYNGRPWSYRSFAHYIAIARGYFVRRGCVGSSFAVLAVRNLLDFWILSLALRSLGLTTMAVRFAEEVGKLGLANVRYVITSLDENWPYLAGVCTELGLPLLSVSLAGQTALELEAHETLYPSGGHILQTSGTTGVYKMVLMTPACDANLLPRRAELFGLNQDSVLCVFDFGPWTGAGYKWLASPWSVGGATLIEQGPKHHALLRPGITHAVVNPSMLAAILAAPAGAFPSSDTLKLAVSGGAMTRTQLDQTKTRVTPRLFNDLGCTEAGTIAFTPLDNPEDQRWHHIAGKIEIVDESNRLAPPGKIGRLRVSTEGGATGYLNDEAATKTFFKDGFFYTGDLAVMRSDGRIALQGRVTDVINVQGDKISPAPIEDMLAERLGVNGTCLISVTNDVGKEEIYVVVESATPIDIGQLNALIEKELRGVKQIRVHYMAALPRNEMGKVSRQEVRAKTIASQKLSTLVD